MKMIRVEITKLNGRFYFRGALHVPIVFQFPTGGHLAFLSGHHHAKFSAANVALAMRQGIFASKPNNVHEKRNIFFFIYAIKGRSSSSTWKDFGWRSRRILTVQSVRSEGCYSKLVLLRNASLSPFRACVLTCTNIFVKTMVQPYIFCEIW